MRPIPDRAARQQTMIIGSGLLARAFRPHFETSPDICIYAAGVSNSACDDEKEFERERVRLLAALARPHGQLVYFGTCSVADPEASSTPYVRHKLNMEALVGQHLAALVLRLPQVAGHTPNPHTLLNFLYAKIARSEAFQIWGGAFLNIIDVADVVTLTRLLLENRHTDGRAVNLANPRCYAMQEIVAAMEAVIGKRAVYQTVARGSAYPIDISTIQPWLTSPELNFDDHYLERVLRKYYGSD